MSAEVPEIFRAVLDHPFTLPNFEYDGKCVFCCTCGSFCSEVISEFVFRSECSTCSVPRDDDVLTGTIISNHGKKHEHNLYENQLVVVPAFAFSVTESIQLVPLTDLRSEGSLSNRVISVDLQFRSNYSLLLDCHVPAFFKSPILDFIRPTAPENSPPCG